MSNPPVHIPRHQIRNVRPIIAEDIKENFTTSEITLEPKLHIISAVNFILNTVIGIGIFTGPGTILEQCGSVGMSSIIWIVCAFIAFLTALPFVELVSVVPKSGSQFNYFYEAFKDYHPFFGQMPSFIYCWLNFVFLSPATFAMHTMISSNYIYAIIFPFFSLDFHDRYSNLIKRIYGTISIGLIGYINCQSLNAYVIAQDFVTYFKMLVCLFLIMSGAFMFMTEQTIDLDIGLKGTTLEFSTLPFVLYICLFTYDGANTVTAVAEELDNPERTVMRSIIMSYAIVLVTYFLMNLSFLSVLTTTEIIKCNAVAKEFADKIYGHNASIFLSVCIALATSGGNMTNMFASTRLGTAAAKEGHLIEFLCYIHCTRLTPTPAIVTQVFLALMFYYVSNSVDTLINVYSFVLWIFYAMTMVALLILRVKKPDITRTYKLPCIVIWIILILSCVLVIFSVITQPATTYIASVFTIASAIPVQYIFVYKKIRIKTLDKATKVLQEWMDVVPPF